jgi:DNA-binding response OmpR family regulator
MDATILVIEESLDLCRLFEYLLRADGYTVRSFRDWQTAQPALIAQDPDLIVYDWALNNADGYRWAEKVRVSTETAHIPILFVCGDQPPRATLEALGNVGISVIDKPFDIFIFRNRITALLGACERVAGARYS